MGPGSAVIIDDPVIAWPIVGVWYVALFIYAHMVVHRRSAAWRWIGVVAAGVWPFLLPPDAGPVRIYLCGYAVVFAAKQWERGVDRVVDPRCWSSLARFWVWWMLPPDHRWPTDPNTLASNRRRGVHRLARGLGAASVFVAMLLLAGRFDVHAHVVSSTAWSLLVIYGFVAAIADTACGLFMIAGLSIAEVFDNPVLSRSPSDFWARRWNRYINEFARRHLFFGAVDRLGLRGAAFGVFLASGLMHEYLIVAWNVGFGSYTGWTMAFFVLQGMGVLGAHALPGRRRWPRPLAIGAHITWMVVTSPLFFAPLAEAIGFTSWAL